MRKSLILFSSSRHCSRLVSYVWKNKNKMKKKNEIKLRILFEVDASTQCRPKVCLCCCPLSLRSWQNTYQINSNGCRRFYCYYGHNLDLEWRNSKHSFCSRDGCLIAWSLETFVIIRILVPTLSCTKRRTIRAWRKYYIKKKNWNHLGFVLSNGLWVTLSREKKGI